MRLSDLIDDDASVRNGISNPEILGVTSDSREVRPGYLFAALSGRQEDGRRYIPDAIARGAVAVLATRPCQYAAPPTPVRLITDDEPRRRLARIAARFYRHQPETVVAVTGTNGKSSIVEFCRQLWSGLGIQAASMGTLGLVSGAHGIEPGLTTPDPVTLHAKLRDLADLGIRHLALEASSHGLDQHRLDAVHLKAAAFSNLSRDHLDYHGTMERYFRAKQRLFGELLDAGGLAVINHAAPESRRISDTCRARGIRVLRFGTGAGADLEIVDQNMVQGGQQLAVRISGDLHQAFLPLAGNFQALNVLAAIGLVAGEDRNRQADCLSLLDRLTGVPGRLQRIAIHPSGADVYVDYAHTPDALHTMLVALRPHVTGRLVCVFGAGGDRDRDKRPIMGQAVAACADHAIVTDDNPRSETASAIRRAILDGCPGADEVGDRASAIIAGLSGLAAGDALVIAGKGHEQGQVVGSEVLPFDDAEIAKRAVLAIGGTLP